jgi:homoserine dehydrogenase
LAEYGREIFDAAAENNVDLYFGASVGGGIPIIRVMREALAGNDIESIDGILNGTCNYILTRMENEGLPFDAVLADAQKLGYAEADPSLDIDGFDTAHKACILASLAYGFQPRLSDVHVEGIRTLSGQDVRYAADFGCRIKLLARVAREGDDVTVAVAPTLVPLTHMLANVNDAFNAAWVKGDMSDYTMYYGRGAGRAPTASTVIGDIGDIARNLAQGQTRYRRGCRPTARAACGSNRPARCGRVSTSVSRWLTGRGRSAPSQRFSAATACRFRPRPRKRRAMTGTFPW